MLELKKITKTYVTESFKQKALDDVSINFRENEFASILGPSGSGKTTLLNIVGGLDHYTSGDLIINGVSTKKYKSHDWDIYRNHRVGFVFQSYNLITHQSVLANVELALTLSGIKKKERKRRAINALKEVGLEKHIHKKPSELSGGQMQRVAIARALVNNPDILLADEPTGALDSETSKQVMDILKQIASNKLVIMVTHNPELASVYSNRIIKLKDGKIVSDSNPFNGDEEISKEEKKSKKKTSMSFLTALNLSLNNLMTKKGRTILTAFAGSIGIIGIALILSLSSGVNEYITSVQKDTMLSYPITIEEETMDLSAFLEQGTKLRNKGSDKEHSNDAIYLDASTIELASKMTTTLYSNNLKAFKEYLDNSKSEIHKYIGDNGIQYSYNTKFKVFNYDADGKLINSDGSTFESKIENSTNLSYLNSYSAPFSSQIFTEIMPDVSGDAISTAIKEEYELIAGDYPKEKEEVLFILPKTSEINLTDIYYLGLLPSKEYKDILDKIDKNEDVKINTEKLSYEDILKAKFKLLTASDFYVKNKKGYYESIIDNDKKVEDLVKNKALEIKVVGILRQKESSKNTLISGTIAYTKDLTNYMIEHTNSSDVIKAAEANTDINITNGLKFNVSTDSEKVKESKKYLSNLNISDKANMALMLIGNNPMVGMMSEKDLANLLDEYLKNPDKKAMVEYYDNYLSPGTYDKVMSSLGKIDLDKPSKVSLYADTFEAKDGITKAIDNYNKSKSEEDKLTYTDYVGLLMSSVTTIINAITYVLIAFVSISLIVSSIMIAIITYISVLERTKEIGILRAIGASKKDVTRVFKAETFIEGLIAGIMGILITVLLNIPINKIIYNLTEIEGISHLPIMGAGILILISVILTVIAGLIPSKAASKKDPVEALRSE